MNEFETEVRTGEKTTARLVVDVSFSNGHVATYTGPWEKRTWFSEEEHRAVRSGASDMARKAAATTGVEIAKVEVFIFKRVTESFERRYHSRELFTTRRGF